MAKSQRQLNSPIIDLDPETGKATFEEEASESLRQDQEAELDSIIKEFDASEDGVVYRAAIHKVPDGYKKGGKEEWCFDVDSTEIEGIRLKMRDIFGPGIYRVRVYKNKELIRMLTYHIAKPLGNGAANMGGDNSLAGLLRVSMERQEAFFNRFMETSQRQPASLPAPTIDPLKMVETMMATAATLAAAMAGGKSGGGDIQMFIQAMELGRDMASDRAPAGGDDSSWGGIVKALVSNPSVIEGLGNALATPRGGNRRQMMPPAIQAPQNQASPNHAGNIPATDAANLSKRLEQNVRYLVTRAAQDSDPGLYAEWLFDNIDGAMLSQMANDPDAMTKLAAVFPGVKQYRPWFDELLGFLKTIIEERGATGGPGDISPPAGNVDASPGGAGGDARNPQADGGASETGSP